MTRRDYSGRTDQAKAAVRRLIDAQKLRSQHRWKGAMYLAGYAIECKLKARLMEIYDLWTLEDLERELTRRVGEPADVFTHSLEILFTQTGARDRMSSATHRSFVQCNRWKTSWRYDPAEGNEDECSAFLDAVETFGRFVDRSI